MILSKTTYPSSGSWLEGITFESYLMRANSVATRLFLSRPLVVVIL